MGNRCVLALFLCALACGKAPAPVVPAPRAPVTKYYEPLAMKDDAKLPGQAVILGTDGDGATVLPLPAGPNTTVVDALFVQRNGNGLATGGSIAVALTTSWARPLGSPDGQQTSGASVSAGIGTGTAPASASGSGSGAPGPTSAATSAPTSPAPSSPTSAATTSPTSTATPGASSAAAGPSNGPAIGPLDAADPGPWQAGLWSAAMVAASALSKDVADARFSAAPAVPGERTASSALIAAGFLASMTGARLDPTATLVGAIEPDGTIGPVAGLPEQLAIAIERGKTRIGYPVGMRIARSLATGKDVDLVRFAREHRAEAVEVATVQDAYQLLARAPLPAPVPVGEAEMGLEADTLERIEVRYTAWRKRLADEWAELLQLEQSGRLPARIRQLVRIAHERSEQAEALYRGGKLASAHARMASAWVSAAAANAAYAVIAKLAGGDVDGAAAALSAAGTAEATTGALLGKIGERRPSSLAGHLAMVAAFQSALRGWSYDAFAADSARAATQLLGGFKGKPLSELSSPATLDAVASAVVPAAVMRFRTIAENDVADRELAVDQGVAYACSPPGVMRIAAVFQGAGAAGIRHVDGLLVEPLARRAAIGDGAARERVAAGDTDYLVADMLLRASGEGLPHDFAASWGERSVSASLLELAGHQLAFHEAAVLIARYDALGVRLDAAGRIEGVAHPGALRSLLASAGRAARSHARAARVATGAIPLQARLAYQLATAEAAGSVADQLDALAQMWTASAYSQLAVMLARN